MTQCPSFNLQPPKREFEVIATSITSSGQQVEIRKVKESFLIPNKNTYATREYILIDPHLIDGIIPDSINDVKECPCCMRLFHISNAFQCPQCKLFAFKPHYEEVDVDGKGLCDVCLVCAKELKTPKIIRIARKLIWGLPDA